MHGRRYYYLVVFFALLFVGITLTSGQLIRVDGVNNPAAGFSHYNVYGDVVGASSNSQIGRESGSHFRDIRWGMSKEEVIDREGDPDDYSEEELEETLYYFTTVADLDSVLFYTFVENKLVLAGYAFLETHPTGDEHWDDFELIETFLQEKYGDPAEEEKVWKEDTYRDSPEDYGKAVKEGDLMVETNWQTEETYIFHTLEAENGEVYHDLIYFSLDLQHLLLEDKEGVDELF